MTKTKIFLTCVLAAFLLLTLNGLSFARKTEITYPNLDIPGIITPTETKALLPEYVQYFFAFAIVIAAIIAFAFLLYAGFHWLISAGSPAVITDAKERIKAAVIGLSIILASAAILETINPQLVIINPGVPVRWGVTLYTDAGCANDGKEITRDTADLAGFTGTYLKFNEGVPAYSLDVLINNDPGKILHSETPGCQNIEAVPTSVRFIWKLPGVYLTKNDGTEKFLPASTATIDDFNDAVIKIKFLDIQGVGLNFGAVLHEHQNWKGVCQVFRGYRGYATSYDLPATHIGTKTSSVTTFVQADNPGSGGVTFYKDNDFGGESLIADNSSNCVDMPDESKNDWATSMRISGSYLAVLFEDGGCAGKCQVFDSSDSNFRDDEIGRCRTGILPWEYKDCLSSYMVLPTK